MTDRSVQYAAEAGSDAGKCQICGKGLAADRMGTGICGSKECHDRMIQKSGEAILARKRARHDEMTEQVFAAVADRIETARDRVRPGALTWMLPAQHEPLDPLPPERLEKFREHLDFCATLAFREPVPETDLSARERHEPPEAPLEDAACATCQGRCCKDRGGDTALLLPKDFARYRQRNPGVTRDEAIEDYLSYLPDRSTRGGCVYQAATGCALPREMRQDICNSFYCDPLRWLRMTAAKAETREAVLVAAHKGEPERIAVVTADGARTPVADFVEGEQ